MFPLKQRDELVFSQPDSLILDDLIVDPAFLQSVALSTNTVPETHECPMQFGVPEENKSDRKRCDKNNIKKITHRDLERQRRQEMSELYASLRSLVPLEHAKGKGAVSDQLQDAVNHIKHKQNDIKELKCRRDKLKKLSNFSGSTEIGSSSGNSNLGNSTVTVNLEGNGVEVLIDGSDQFKLSKVLKELVQRQVNVFSCVSTKANERFLHKIQAEAVNMTSLDLSLLQDRLIHLFN